MRPEAINEIDERVKIALELWAKDVKNDKAELKHLGYGELYMYGGHGSVSSVEDLEDSANGDLINHVEAIYTDLRPIHKSAINHFHLSAVWSSPRISIEEAYSQALDKMKRGLQERGMV